MSRSPLTPSPYEVLGVGVGASDHELRRAYRRMLRETHPDTGGDAAQFVAVQKAWELLGTPAGRAAYDRGRSGAGATSSSSPFAAGGAGSSEGSRASWAPAGPRQARDSRPPARSFGHPGGHNRERYLTLMREWVGRGAALPDPYDPALVRTAPRGIRHLLADALAEEATASQLAGLGIGYTVWHDIDTEGPRGTKLDHIVLGPSGLFAVQSEDWGAPVGVRRNEITGEGLAAGERPLHSLAAHAKHVGRAARVRFTGLVVVVPDEFFADDLLVGRMRGLASAVVCRSRLPGLLREGIPGAPHLGGTELFEVRTRLQGAVRFV